MCIRDSLRRMLEDLASTRLIDVRIGAPFNVLLLNNPTNCSAALSRATIKADGTVHPCEAFKELSQSLPSNSIRNNTLRDIWEESAVFREARILPFVIAQSACSRCELFGNCRGGCPAQRLAYSGSIMNTVDPFCVVCRQEVIRTERE